MEGLRVIRATRTTGLALVLALGPLLMAGCDDGRRERYPVSGRVLLDGQPMPFGQIQVDVAGQRASSGQIRDGRFVLGCFEFADGCVPGTHPVIVEASKYLGPTKVQWFAPPKYASLATSDLTITVDGPTDDLVIELETGEPGGFKPFVQRL